MAGQSDDGRSGLAQRHRRAAAGTGADAVAGQRQAQPRLVTGLKEESGQRRGGGGRGRGHLVVAQLERQTQAAPAST